MNVTQASDRGALACQKRGVEGFPRAIIGIQQDDDPQSGIVEGSPNVYKLAPGPQNYISGKES